MDVDIPIRPEDPRPDERPFYADRICDCGTEYVPFTSSDVDDWNDEFYCPDCDEGIFIDKPKTWVHQLIVKVGEEQRS